MRTIKIKRFLMGASLFLFLMFYIGYPVFFLRAREKADNHSDSYTKVWRKRGHDIAVKADTAEKRGDYAAEERYLTQAAEQGYGDWAYLAHFQHKHGEYQAEFVSRAHDMEPPEFCGKGLEGDKAVLIPCQPNPPGAKEDTEAGHITYLLRYAEAADRAAPQESARIWKRLIAAMNRNGVMGKTLPIVAGHTLTHDQIHALARAVNALWGGSIEEPRPNFQQKKAAVQAALQAVPQCDAARKWLADDLYAQRYADFKGTPHIREAERQYKILVHSSDEAIREDAARNLKDIAAFRAEASKWVPANQELDYAYARSPAIRKVNDKALNKRQLP